MNDAREEFLGLLGTIDDALSQAQDCINQETPEELTVAEANEDTISKIRDAMRVVETLRAAPARCDAVTTKAIAAWLFDTTPMEKCDCNELAKDLLKQFPALVPPPSEAGREALHEALNRAYYANIIIRLDRWTDETLKRGYASSWHYGELWTLIRPAIVAALSPDPGTVAVASADRGTEA